MESHGSTDVWSFIESAAILTVVLGERALLHGLDNDSLEVTLVSSQSEALVCATRS